MVNNSEVNQAFAAWKLSTGREKEWTLHTLSEEMEKLATAICLRKLPDHKAEISDLVHTIVCRALKGIEGFKADSSFKTWFHTISTNECNRYLQKVKERCETSLHPAIAAITADVDVRLDLIKLLDSLRGDDHELFRLVAEGYDFKEIGKTLGITRNAALVRWSRLKGRLQDAV